MVQKRGQTYPKAMKLHLEMPKILGKVVPNAFKFMV